MLNENKYKDFDERAFICDPAFQNWVLNKTSGDEQFWKHFFEIHPSRKDAADIASNFLLNVQFKEDLPEDSSIEELFARHQADIKRLSEAKVIDAREKFLSIKFLRIAAVLG